MYTNATVDVLAVKGEVTGCLFWRYDNLARGQVRLCEYLTRTGPLQTSMLMLAELTARAGILARTPTGIS